MAAARNLVTAFIFIALTLLPVGNARGDAPVTIDFDRAAVPWAMRAAITSAVDGKPAAMLPAHRFAIVSLRVEGRWALATLATLDGALDGDPEGVGMAGDGALVIAQQDSSGMWRAALEGTTTFALFVGNAPEKILDHVAKEAVISTKALAPSSPSGVTLKFPWDSSQRWYYTQAWHYGNNVDFAPVWSVANKWVLAAHAGTVTRLCVGILAANVQVKNADGTVTGYSHLDKTSIPNAILGRVVEQGQMLGKAYNGSLSSTDGCGYSTGPHVHFGLPSQNVTVDDWTAHPDGTWTQGSITKTLMSTFSSTNVLIDGVTPRVFIPFVLR